MQHFSKGKFQNNACKYAFFIKDKVQTSRNKQINRFFILLQVCDAEMRNEWLKVASLCVKKR